MKPSSRILIISAIVLAFTLAVSLVASFLTRGIIEKAARKPTGETSLPSPTPKERSLYADLPQTFPKDIPLITRSKVTVGSQDEGSWTAVLQTLFPLAEVRAFYEKELPKAGWQISSQSQAGEIVILYTSKQSREAIVAIGKDETGVTVSITIFKD